MSIHVLTVIGKRHLLEDPIIFNIKAKQDATADHNNYSTHRVLPPPRCRTA